jgi:hypothetical protein
METRPPRTTTLKLYKQRRWSDSALITAGFRYYRPVKRMTMARILPAQEAPLVIRTAWDTITATAGYIIAYVPGDSVKTALTDYDPRPIEPQVFALTYSPWDEPDWQPTPSQAHLLSLGCKPYYKIAGVWAKQLKRPTLVQSLESEVPATAPVGAWLCIGTAGEPWSVTADWFQTRYQVPGAASAAP